MRCMTWLRAVLVTAVVLSQSLSAHAAPEIGWWWNPDESGRGFFVESRDDLIYVAGYFYDEDGRAKWLVAGGPNSDPYRYDGRLLEYANGQTLLGDYKPPSAPVDRGPISLRFTDDRHGTLTWPGGTIAIQRHEFGEGVAAFRPDSGWWWNEAESGRGYSVEVQGSSFFMVGFMYDDAGKPLWYFSAGPMASPTSFAGAILQFANGQTMTGSYHPPSAPVKVGDLAVDFTGIDTADFEFTGEVASRLQPEGVKTVIIEVKREFPAKPTYTPAERYAGTFHQTAVLKYTSAVQGQSIITVITVDVKGTVTWDNGGLPDLPSAGDKFRKPSYTYSPVLPQSPVDVTYTQTQDGAGAHCAGSFTDNLVDNGSTLRVNGYAQYRGEIKFKELNKTFELKCTYEDGGMLTSTIPALVEALIPLKGAAVPGGIDYKTLAPQHPAPFITVTRSYTFAAITP